MRKIAILLLKICFAAITVVAVFGVSACDDSALLPSETGTQDAFTADVFDVYVKLGDGMYDYTANLPEGVTVDASEVNVSEIGAYEIIYKQGSAKQVKTAYVCGTPTFFCADGNLEETRTLTYAQANEMDFMRAETCKIFAEDSFGNALKVVATADEYYIGNYGTYTVKYSATDYAGNVAEVTVTYTVSAGNAPSIAFTVPDVADDDVKFSATFTQTELDEMTLYVNNRYVERTDYERTTAGLRIGIKNFLADLERGEKTYTVRIDAKQWYSETVVSFTDEKTPVFEDLAFDKWIFAESEQITLAAPQKLKPQAIEFSYSMSGGNGGTVEVDENGKTLTIRGNNDIVQSGTYTVTVNALRGGVVQSSKDAEIRVYTQEDFGKVILPLNSTQFDGDLFAKFSAVVDFSFDAEKGAYKMWTDTRVTDGNSGDTLIFDPTGSAYQKFLRGFGKYNYVAMDICFIEPPDTGGTVVIYLQDRTGYPYQHTKNATTVAVYDEAQGKRMSMSDLQAGVWYTYYCDAYAFDERVHTNSGTPLIGRQVKDTLGYAGAYYLRNVRFVDEEFGGGRLGNGYVAQTDRYYTLPTFGETNPQYTVTPSAGVSVVGNTVRMTAAGEYQARLGDNVLNFTVYTAAEYENVVAVMSCEQFSGQFYGFAATANNPLVLITFDEQESAYKFVNNPSSPAGANQVRVTKGSEMYDKMANADGEGKYLVFTIKFEIAPKETNHNMIFYFNKDAGATEKVNQTLTTEGVAVYETGTHIPATRATMVTDKWYDVYVPLGTFSENGTLIGTQGVVDGAYWISNIRISATA